MADKNILIIEDIPANLELSQDLLELAGYQVLAATMAEDGIEIARNEIPDLILMDIRLPGIDGYEAIKLLQQDHVTRHIPIVVLTSSAIPEDMPKALAAGAVGYITKPIDTRQFVSLIADYLKTGKA